jgi:hypothetical protein
VPRLGGLLFEFYRERDHKFFRCELRDHGQCVEAAFFEGDHGSFYAQMCSNSKERLLQSVHERLNRRTRRSRRCSVFMSVE